jgi:hypothetical protein
VHARCYINALTGVDPGNFPTALTALTVLNTLVGWLVILPLAIFVIAGIYAGVPSIGRVRRDMGLADIGGISAESWKLRALWLIVFTIFSALLLAGLADSLLAQRVGRIIATSVLVATEYSYDRTCAVSSEQRLVARLKDFKEWKASMVSIVE